jgi:hypothetical protein
MKTKGILYISVALLIALCMTASACDVCGTVLNVNRNQIADQLPGSTVTITVPGGLPSGMTWVWTLNIRHQDNTLESHTITPATGNSVVVPVVKECGTNVEMGVVITMSNSDQPSCTLAKCIWWQIPCPACPTLNSFCQGKAEAGDAAKFNSVPSAYYWDVDSTPASHVILDPGSVTAADLNALLCTQYETKVARLYIDGTTSPEICHKTFKVWCNPPDFTPTV